jgi:hypothetical protein
MNVYHPVEPSFSLIAVVTFYPRLVNVKLAVFVVTPEQCNCLAWAQASVESQQVKDVGATIKRI